MLAQTHRERSQSPEDPFVVAASSSRLRDEDGLHRHGPARRPHVQTEQEEEFAETLATSSPTSHRGHLSHSNGQGSTGLPGSPAAPRSPRSSMQKARGGGSTAASTGHHTSTSSICNARLSADSTAPLPSGSALSPRPSQNHEPGLSDPQASPSTFAEQQAAAPFSQTVPAHDSSNYRSTDHSRSSSSKEKDKERSVSQINGKERERSSRRQLGEWTLGKTLGAGSMGKVKLGVSAVTGEKVSALQYPLICL